MNTTSDYRSKARSEAVRKHTLAMAVSAAVMASALTTPAWAQTLEEVIVTATKRSESVQDVPLAITALSGEFINKVNLTDVKDLVAYTPGVSGNSQDSFIDAISVRGIRTQDFGLGLDPSSAFFKNDLYEGRNGSAVSTLYDLNRAEVLRGPQGFLFGRNSIGGAFSVHTRRAEIDSSDGYIQAGMGERDIANTEGAINIPLGDKFAMRLAGFYSTEDGFVDNFNGGDDLILEADLPIGRRLGNGQSGLGSVLAQFAFVAPLDAENSVFGESDYETNGTPSYPNMLLIEEYPGQSFALSGYTRKLRLRLPAAANFSANIGISVRLVLIFDNPYFILPSNQVKMPNGEALSSYTIRVALP